MNDIELSKHTRPGRLGFVHCLEIKTKSKEWHKTWELQTRLHNELTHKLSKVYQPHWVRPQPKCRWYFYRINYGNTYRYCFKFSRDRFVARLLATNTQ